MNRKITPASPDGKANAPLMLFGAFDRHNLGDLLFPHILAKLLEPREVVFAGLAERNLTHWGGHRVRAIVEVASAWGEREANVIHVGGELLTCDAWEAAVMLLPPEEAGGVIGHLDGTPQRFAWARRYLGVEGRVPYCLPKSLFRHPGRFVFNGVGGVDLDRRDPVLREEVLAKLAAADEVGVRDRTTLGMLTRAGIAAQLVPDPVARVAELFGDRIRDRARKGEPAETGRAFPQGYIALQFSADFGDDATLAAIAAQLDRVIEASGLGVAFFRAGAAPWHDDPACYRAVAERMLSPNARLFESLDIWDICALIADARVFCGSSLHGRIVAAAFGVPAVSFMRQSSNGQGPGKVAAYGATWGWPAASLCEPGVFAAELRRLIS